MFRKAIKDLQEKYDQFGFLKVWVFQNLRYRDNGGYVYLFTQFVHISASTSSTFLS
jgi:hypothetical protein